MRIVIARTLLDRRLGAERGRGLIGYGGENGAWLKRVGGGTGRGLNGPDMGLSG